MKKTLDEVNKTFTKLIDDDDLTINNKIYSQKLVKVADKYTVQFLIDKTNLQIVEVVKINIINNSELNFDVKRLNKMSKLKCQSELNTLKYSLTDSMMALFKNDKLVWAAKSKIINDRIKDDSDKKCLNRWGH